MFKSKHNTNLISKELPPVGSNVKIIDDDSLMYGAGESGEVVTHVEDAAVVRVRYGLGCFEAHILELVDETEKERETLIRVLCGGRQECGWGEIADRVIKSGWKPNAPQRTETKESRQDLFDRAISDVSDRGKFEPASLDLSMKIEKLIGAGWRPTK